MVSTTIQNWIVFVVLFLIFLPFLSKVVRLASSTWDNREHLEKKRVQQIVFMVPILVIIVFILIYIGVIAFLDLIKF
ncbi:MAG: hypothetical protein ACXAB7_14770 [Candidatus Kariarchaeaceae archaeon]|jgi:hypothetical protein